MLEPMHKAEPYGHLLLRGKRPDYAELADVASCTLREVKYSIEELVNKGALSVTDDGIIYSRRMVRDAERRAIQSAHGKRGGRPTQSNQALTEMTLKGSLSHTPKPIEARDQRLEVREQTRPAEKAPAPTREFLNWFQGEYKARRNGATYFVRWDAHGAIVKRLLTAFPVDRLKKHAQILLTTDEEWTTGTDRGVEILSAKINWLEERLCAWEAKRKAREAV
jgi:hypothetical protein